MCTRAFKAFQAREGKQPTSHSNVGRLGRTNLGARGKGASGRGDANASCLPAFHADGRKVREAKVRGVPGPQLQRRENGHSPRGEQGSVVDRLSREVIRTPNNLTYAVRPRVAAHEFTHDVTCTPVKLTHVCTDVASASAPSGT